MLHAKIMTVDGAVANVGSSNFNSRSLEFDDEVNLVMFDTDLVATLDAHFAEDVRRSEPIDPSAWKYRSVVQRVKEGVTELVEEHL